MSPALIQYLTANYRRKVLNESVPVVTPHVSSDLVDEIKKEIVRIDALKLGANLAQRAFVDYQNRRALVDLLELLEIGGTFALRETADRGVFLGSKSANMAATEAGDTAGFTGGVT